MHNSETPYREELPGGICMRTLANPADLERVAEFNTMIHGPEVGTMTRRLFNLHPRLLPNDLVFIENDAGQILSTLCLIPWAWRCAGVELRAGEMGIVGTREDQRGRGLIRILAGYFMRRLQERGCVLSQIQGIAYFYRQFGYAYMLPLEGGWHIETHQIHEEPSEPYTWQPMALSDLPDLMRLYDQAAADLEIHATRDEPIWRYLQENPDQTDGMVHETLVARRGDGPVEGYMRLPRYHFGEQLVVDEVSRLGVDAALSALHHLKELAITQQLPGIRLNLPVRSALTQVARSLGARDAGTYSWQIHVPDAVALLRTLAPALEQRLAGSIFAGLTKDVLLNLYRETIILRFETGKLLDVSTRPGGLDSPIRIPPPQLIPLILGHRTLDEVRVEHPDVGVSGTSQLLIETLFPRMSAFIYSMY